MGYQPNATQRRTIIEMILAQTPYIPQSAKYQEMEKDLSKLKWDTLIILRQSQKGSTLTDQEAEFLIKEG